MFIGCSLGICASITAVSVIIMIASTVPFLTSYNTQLYDVSVYNGYEVIRGRYEKYAYSPGKCRVWNTSIPIPTKCSKIIGQIYDSGDEIGICYDKDICVETVAKCDNVWICEGDGRNKKCRLTEVCKDVCSKYRECLMQWQLAQFQYIIARNEDKLGNGVFDRTDCLVASKDSEWNCNVTIASNLTVYIPVKGFDQKNYMSYTTPPNYIPTIAFIVCLIVSVIAIAVVTSANLVYYDKVDESANSDVFFTRGTYAVT